MSDSSWPHESQHAKPPCPSPTPGVHPNSNPSSRWCHPAISAIKRHVLSHFSSVQLFETPWISARQASLSITNSWSLPELMSIESVILSNYLILCRPLLLLPAPQSLTEEIWIRLGGCINVIFPVAIYMIVMQDISFRENWSVLRFLCTVSYNCAWS